MKMKIPKPKSSRDGSWRRDDELSRAIVRVTHSFAQWPITQGRCAISVHSLKAHFIYRRMILSSSPVQPNEQIWCKAAKSTKQYINATRSVNPPLMSTEQKCGFAIRASPALHACQAPLMTAEPHATWSHLPPQCRKYSGLFRACILNISTRRLTYND